MEATVYDFTWDDQCDQGVWVQPAGTTSDSDWMLVEAMVCEADDPTDPDSWASTGLYLLASNIVLTSEDGIWRDGDDEPIFGAEARQALRYIQKIEANSTQVAVNEQQRQLGLTTPGEAVETQAEAGEASC
jgi:hypothetical protein